MSSISLRYIEIDLTRSLAIFCMIVYHLAFDLHELYGFHFDFWSPAWNALRIATVCLFLLIVGISFTISNAKPDARYSKHFKRGVAVLACGLAISALSYWYVPSMYVRFGILHMIGVSILILPFFARFGYANALLGIALIVAGQFVQRIHISTPLLIPLGINPPAAYLDYYPMLPWFVVVLIGFCIGRLLYIEHLKWRTTSIMQRLQQSRLTHLLASSGRYALLIYLIHQPIIIGILSFFYGIPTFA